MDFQSRHPVDAVRACRDRSDMARACLAGVSVCCGTTFHVVSQKGAMRHTCLLQDTSCLLRACLEYIGLQKHSKLSAAQARSTLFQPMLSKPKRLQKAGTRKN